jgi:hypothetical protein
MKIKALSNIVNDFPEADTIIELPDGQRIHVTGFWVRKDKNHNHIIVIKASKKLSK